MWVVGLLRSSSETSAEPIGGRFRAAFGGNGSGDGESGPIALVDCGASEAAATVRGDHGPTIRCRTAELGDRLTALWEDGCAASIVDLGTSLGANGTGGDGDGDPVAYLDLAVVEIDAARFKATQLGSALARLDAQAVPFFFLMSGMMDGEDIPPEIPVTLAQFGTVCPFPLPAKDRDSALRRLADYVRQRLDKHYGPREDCVDGTATGAERRAFPRWQLDRPAIAAVAGRNHPCRVVDISGGGLALDLAGGCTVGDAIVVTIEAVRPLSGTVVRVGEHRVGVRFAMDAAEHSDALALIAEVVAGRAQAAE